MIRKWRVYSLFLLLTLVLAGCGEPYLSTLRPVGEVADKQFFLTVLSTLIMVLVVIVVSIIFFYVIIKFKRSKVGEDTIPKQVEGTATWKSHGQRFRFFYSLFSLYLLWHTRLN